MSLHHWSKIRINAINIISEISFGEISWDKISYIGS